MSILFTLKKSYVYCQIAVKATLEKHNSNDLFDTLSHYIIQLFDRFSNPKVNFSAKLRFCFLIEYEAISL